LRPAVFNTRDGSSTSPLGKVKQKEKEDGEEEKKERM